MAGAEPAKKSDLGVRTASAVVMVAVAGTALWLGGPVWAGFVALVAAGVYFEFVRLVRAVRPGGAALAAWLTGGFAYVALAAAMLALLGLSEQWGRMLLFAVIAGVIGTDVGAYFSGRAIGGPKIAPAISPSKTWAGLGGGMLGASAMLLLVAWLSLPATRGGSTGEGHLLFATPFASMGEALVPCLVVGPVLAVLAQSGDFFESWLKRRAGVKDSGKLIPGHGGLFDRVDGMLAVLFVLGLLTLYSILAPQ